jgi:hypothetical protein
MNMHKNARLTPLGRERIVQRADAGCRQRNRSRLPSDGWVERYRREGLAGLQDRSSRPHRLRRQTPQPVIEQIEWLRRQRSAAAPAGAGPQAKHDSGW